MKQYVITLAPMLGSVEDEQGDEQYGMLYVAFEAEDCDL